MDNKFRTVDLKTLRNVTGGAGNWSNESWKQPAAQTWSSGSWNTGAKTDWNKW